MKNRLIPCVLACLMIFLVGCNGNTAKEAAQEITKTETSFPAGNTETNSQEDTAKEPESTAVQEETPITAKESQSTAESQTVMTVQTKPAEEKTADTPATEKPKAEPPKQTTTQTEPEKQTEQPKEQTTAEQKPVEKPTEKPAEPKPTEPHKQTFDVSPYVSYAKEYAVSIGLSLDITATECWDNPISANPNRSGIKSDIESRLNRYKKVEGFTFRVTGVNGYDRSFTTDKNGEIVIEGLRIGDYTVSEVQDSVSASYVLPADKIATVKVGSTTVVEMHNELRDTPKTGDNSNVGLWTALAGLSALGIVGTAVVAYRKKKKEDNE